MLIRDKLGCLPFVDMFKLVECGHLHKNFRELKGKMIVCHLCVFVKAKHSAWCGCDNLVPLGILLRLI